MDYPYFVFYLLLILLAFLYWRTDQGKYAKWAYAIAFVFFAFRAPVVGADTWDYVRYLTGERNFYNYDLRPIEPLFIVYREILCHLTNSRFLVMIINTIVTFAPLYYITKKYSLNPPLTILFFCFLGGMFIYFVGLRQIIALGVLYVALIYWIQEEGRFKRKVCVFIVCTLIAYFIHTSAILYALIFCIALIPFHVHRLTYFILVMGSALVGIVLAKFNVLDFFSLILELEFSSVERLDVYLDNNELNDSSPLNILLRLSVFALITFFYTGRDKLSHPFLKIFLAEVIMFNLLYSVPMAPRLCYPLAFFGAIGITWTMDKSIQQSQSYKYLHIIIVLIVLYYFRSQTIELSSWDKNDSGRMHPYYFIFEDYSDHPSITRF